MKVSQKGSVRTYSYDESNPNGTKCEHHESAKSDALEGFQQAKPVNGMKYSTWLHDLLSCDPRELQEKGHGTLLFVSTVTSEPRQWIVFSLETVRY